MVTSANKNQQKSRYNLLFKTHLYVIRQTKLGKVTVQTILNSGEKVNIYTKTCRCYNPAVKSFIFPLNFGEKVHIYNKACRCYNPANKVIFILNLKIHSTSASESHKSRVKS